MKKLIFILLLTSQLTVAQKYIYGIIKDELVLLEKAHIINLNSKEATYSEADGSFRILAKIGDDIQISHVGYEVYTIKNKVINFGLSQKEITLKKETVFLDEVTIKNHDLSGSIDIDLQKTPKNKALSNAKNAINSIKKIPISDIENMAYGKDELHLIKVAAPGIPGAFEGAGAIASMPDYHGIKKRAIRKLIKFKEAFPKMLLSEFGEQFFFTELKIPKDKYLHFLDFCENIEDLYKADKKLELIQQLKKESFIYLKKSNDRLKPNSNR